MALPFQSRGLGSARRSAARVPLPPNMGRRRPWTSNHLAWAVPRGPSRVR